MEDNIIYPIAEQIIEYNILVLNMIKVKKADKAQVLKPGIISNIINRCKETEGDIYDKAVCLFKGLVQEHAFASGNRRTAFITTKYFIKANKGKFGIKDDPQYARPMQGVRENYYTDEEIKEWIKNGKIKEFKR
ncbi:MAG: type II toxin-antitoxin system death-on-curing family toxin [Nanoarchaeota archaeon]|nr:type II toxin-antitoxin system death-on-curing family toxin [Nanoarchaeota archaeon]MBU1004321.1 type II toxin-antitoxin system death-on-curing family toxin [Nanoarchaeota archaeon]MBU1945461.1 type II toxin-antitoxin system death-on-curing family toxin [Nanoarchaeota archaeon]